MIGLLGGTFDPVHYGHLRPAHEVLRRLELAELRLVPAARPPHRRPPFASPEQRLRMVELAVPEFPGLAADDREVRRGGVSYTVPTLEALRAELGSHVPVCFVLGADAFAGLPSWHRWEALFELAHLVVMERPGAPLAREALPSWAASRLCDPPEALARRPAGSIVLLPVTQYDISATRLREIIARGGTPSFDEIPRAVWEYIQRHNLYRSTAA
ncbi:MAG TPA: nicotinate-nucleotide adenylyltransferase [Burkholderiales bacterium]